MARQTMKPDEWIVADGGQKAATLTMGQVHLHQPSSSGAANLAGNIIRALDSVTGDVVIIAEDDDVYLPNHIEACVDGLKKTPAYGCSRLVYFNVAHRLCIQMANRGSALCQTAFRKELIPDMRRAAQEAMAAGDFGIDGRFWANRKHMATGSQTVVGVKGLAGTPGLGIGHRPKSSMQRRWRPDPDLKQLRALIGSDVENYL